MLFTCLWFASRPRPRLRNKPKRYETNMKYAWENRRVLNKDLPSTVNETEFVLSTFVKWVSTRTHAHTHLHPHTQLYAYFVHVSSCRKVHWLPEENVSRSQGTKSRCHRIFRCILSTMTKSRIKRRRRDSVNTHTYAEHIVHTCVAWICGMNLHVISCQYRRALNAINLHAEVAF